MSKVLEDLNFACQNLSGDTKYNGVINKWVALAFKSRVCLYEGTFRKYHSKNPSTNTAWTNQYETANKFLEECVSASEALMGGQFSLHPDYYDFFHMTNIASSPEAIWWSDYDSGELNRMHELTWVVNSSTYDQQVSPTKLMVNHYLNLDGTPITHEGKVSINEEFVGRDKRLEACVHHPGYMYTKTNGEQLLKQTNTTYTYNFYQNVKFSIEIEENYSKGKNDNDYPILRYGEVLLNYAEAKAELGTLTDKDWEKTIGALRARAGITGGLKTLPAVVDQTFQSTYFPNVEDPIILEVRRERSIELCLEGFRMKDLRRWARADLWQRAKWTGVFIPGYDNLIDINGDGVNDVYFNNPAVPNAPSNVAQYVVTLNANVETVTVNGGFILQYTLKGRKWDDRMYLDPICGDDILMNQNLTQNPGY